MSYVIIRNEKLTRAKAMGAYKHNERKTKNHSNKNIDSSKTELNYYLKKNGLSYIKEFDRIKEKYDLIKQLYNENLSLHKELSKQTTIIDKAEKFEKEQVNLLSSNMELKNKCRKLELDFSNKEKELKYKYEHETYKVDYQYQKIISKLEKENNYLKKVIEKFKVMAQKFISWVCHKFSYSSEDALIRNFEKETYTDFDININHKTNNFEKEKDNEIELN